jgi:hypothetical protein
MQEVAMYAGYWRNTAIAIVTCLQLASGTVQAAEKTYTANDLFQDCKDTLLERATLSYRRILVTEGVRRQRLELAI